METILNVASITTYGNDGGSVITLLSSPTDTTSVRIVITTPDSKLLEFGYYKLTLTKCDE